MNSKLRDINKPYKSLDHKGIEYSVCKDYDHISRYRNLRQVVHNPNDVNDRFISLETVNTFLTTCEIEYYEVKQTEENRLDLIAKNKLGSATYSWVISYFNSIDDGFTVRPGQRLKIPRDFTSLFNTGELLEPVNPLSLNLGSE